MCLLVNQEQPVGNVDSVLAMWRTWNPLVILSLFLTESPENYVLDPIQCPLSIHNYQYLFCKEQNSVHMFITERFSLILRRLVLSVRAHSCLKWTYLLCEHVETSRWCQVFSSVASPSYLLKTGSPIVPGYYSFI